jgi:hypothetical protein
MTTKTFSQSGRMGRNPFGKPVVSASATASTAAEAPKRAGAPKRPAAEKHDEPESLIFTALALPLRTVLFGLKSLMVARYLFAHREEWKF